jgi:hypothetical protein
VNGVFVFCLFLFQRGGHLGKKKSPGLFLHPFLAAFFFSRPSDRDYTASATCGAHSLLREHFSIDTDLVFVVAFFFLRAGSKEYDWAFDGVLCSCFSLLYCVVLVAVVLDVCAFFLAPP